MRKAQLSIIDLYITIIAVAISSTFLLSINTDYKAIELRFKDYYDKSLVISLFNYNDLSIKINEFLCNNKTDPKDEFLLAYDKLRSKDENFIIFISNKTYSSNKIPNRLLNGGLLFYNNETSVCLNKVNLINFNYLTTCGELVINYGSWTSGEELC